MRRAGGAHPARSEGECWKIVGRARVHRPDAPAEEHDHELAALLPRGGNLAGIRIGGPTALRPAAPLSVELSRLAHEPAPQVDDLDAVPVGCFVTGFGDDGLGIRVANFPQGRDLSFEGAFL